MKKNIINLSRNVRIVQAFEIDASGAQHEYQEIIFSDDASGTVHTVSFTHPEISSENLRTAADEIDNFRLENA